MREFNIEENEITIPLEEYNKLIESRTKAEQYKNFLMENSNNNQITKGLVIIEGKNLYQLIKEKQNKEDK